VIHALLDTHLPGLGPQQRNGSWMQRPVAAYHARLESPVVPVVCDGRAQFTLVTDELALCWVHEGATTRNWCVVPHHRALLETRAAFLVVLRPVVAYRADPTRRGDPTDRRVETLLRRFHGLRSAGRADSQDTYKQGCLLLVLVHPEISPPQQPAELGARARVRNGM